MTAQHTGLLYYVYRYIFWAAVKGIVWEGGGVSLYFGLFISSPPSALYLLYTLLSVYNTQASHFYSLPDLDPRSHFTSQYVSIFFNSFFPFWLLR